MSGKKLGKRAALWTVMSGFRRHYAAAIGALAVGTGLAYLVPLVSRATIDAILADRTAASAASTSVLVEWLGGREAVLSRLWLPALLIAVLAAASGVFLHLKGRWAAMATEGIIRRLRDRLCDHLNHLPCKYFDAAETGDLVQRCTSDVETVRHFLALQVVEVGRAVLLLLTVVPIMLALDVGMTAVSLAGVPLIVAFSIVFFLKIKPMFLRMDEAEGRMTTVLQENLTGIRVVRAFARQEFEREKFGRTIADYRDHHFRLIQLLAVFWTTSDLMVFCQQAAVVLIGAQWVRSGQLSVGTLVAFLVFVNMFIWPVRQMGRILADLGKALVALGRIDEILRVEHEEDPSETADVKPGRCLGRIAFEHVTFAYHAGEPVLRDVSFEVEAGQTLAILGPSGAGKSTIVSLLLRLYDSREGTIRLDGRVIRELPRKWLRSQMSVVLQEPFLYSKTVRENIALGRRDAEDQELLEAAHAAAIHEAISSFEKGYDTLVGERGVTLSGGQRQRVALARALLQRPAVLILDDALSAVDTTTEALILRALRERHGRQTTLVIAHRVSTLQQADVILVLDHGRVVQWGTPARLATEEGLYRRLCQLQGDESLARASG